MLLHEAQLCRASMLSTDIAKTMCDADVARFVGTASDYGQDVVETGDAARHGLQTNLTDAFVPVVDSVNGDRFDESGAKPDTAPVFLFALFLAVIGTINVSPPWMCSPIGRNMCRSFLTVSVIIGERHGIGLFAIGSMGRPRLLRVCCVVGNVVAVAAQTLSTAAIDYAAFEARGNSDRDAHKTSERAAASPARVMRVTEATGAMRALTTGDRTLAPHGELPFTVPRGGMFQHRRPTILSHGYSNRMLEMEAEMADATYRTMTTEHLGVGADEGDLARFVALCKARQYNSGMDDEEVTEEIFAQPQLWMTTECVYCNAPVSPEFEPVPDASDEAAWTALAEQHAADCEWIVTRAHRRFDDAAQAS